MNTKKIYTVAFTLAALIGLSSFALAQDRTPRVDRREYDQQARIARGVRNGSLTRGETRRIERDEAKVRRDEYRAKADGVVTPRERARLNRELNQTSREIRHDEHNGVYRRW